METTRGGENPESISPAVNFINIFLRAFFVQIFGAKQNVTRENNVRTKNLCV
jgi:hypothetical protein